ncbi:MAG: alkaline phosphatase family protein, partial [Planctomycetota bacterium]
MTIALACLLALAQQTKPTPPPRLVVLISVDQMIPEQLQRLEPHLAGGFGRFLREGAVFWRATVDYAAT